MDLAFISKYIFVRASQFVFAKVRAVSKTGIAVFADFPSKSNTDLDFNMTAATLRTSGAILLMLYDVARYRVLTNEIWQKILRREIGCRKINGF